MAGLRAGPSTPPGRDDLCRQRIVFAYQMFILTRARVLVDGRGKLGQARP